VDQLLGRGRVPMSSSIDVEIINQFFDEEVANVRSSTDNAPSPTFTHTAAGLTLNEFCTLSVDDVTSSVRQLPDKSSAADPIPNYVLKQTIDLLAPFVAELFNRSLAADFTGRFNVAGLTMHLSRQLSRRRV